MSQKENDPAARTGLEVLLTYPGVKALAAHRFSHWLWTHNLKLWARMNSQFWRFGHKSKFIQESNDCPRSFYRSRFWIGYRGDSDSRNRC